MEMMMADCKAAIALNNMGITLLEKQCYPQAMATLKDAVSMIKRAFKARGGGAKFVGQDQSSVSADRSLRRASQRLFRPDERSKTTRQPRRTSLSNPFRPSSLDAPVQLHVFSQHLLANAANHALLEGPGSSTSACPIRIEDFECFETMMQPGDMDLESTIILYNFAVSYICMSETSKRNATKFRCGALTLLRIAQSIVSSRQELLVCCSEEESQSSSFSVDSSHLFAQLISMEVLVVNCMVQLERDNNNADQVLHLYNELSELRTVLHELEGASLVPLADSTATKTICAAAA